MSNPDFITTDFWESVSDFSWDENKWNSLYVNGCLDIGNETVFCPTDEVVNLFNWLNHFNWKEKFTLVTAYSDAGIHLQQNAHPNKDLYKASLRIDYSAIERDRDNYHQYQLETIKPGSIMNPRDKYIIKMDSYSYGTFDKVPDCISRWYTCNLNCEVDRTKIIPFGVNHQGHGKDIVQSYHTKTEEKNPCLYINFQINTLERQRLHEKLTGNRNLRKLVCHTRKIEEFYADLSSCRFVACPAGNGLDCYRVYEALLVGSIPVLLKTPFSKNLQELGFPVYLTESLEGLSNDELNLGYEIIKQTKTSLDALKRELWSNFL